MCSLLGATVGARLLKIDIHTGAAESLLSLLRLRRYPDSMKSSLHCFDIGSYELSRITTG